MQLFFLFLYAGDTSLHWLVFIGGPDDGRKVLSMTGQLLSQLDMILYIILHDFQINNKGPSIFSGYLVCL